MSQPMFSVSSEELRHCPVMFAIKLHDGRIIWTTGKFVEGSIEIQTPRPEERSTFGEFNYRQYFNPYQGFARTDIDVTLRTDQIGWKEGTPQWEPIKEIGDGTEKPPVDLDVRGNAVPVQEIKYLPQGPRD